MTAGAHHATWVQAMNLTAPGSLSGMINRFFFFFFFFWVMVHGDLWGDMGGQLDGGIQC
jgi:hypothetical protein